MDRDMLLQRIYAWRTRLEALLEPLSPEQMTAPSLPNGWSLKDWLAHMGFWERRAVEIFRDLLAGREPAGRIGPAEVDALNGSAYEEYRSLDLDAVRKFERAAYREIANLVETAPEEDLFEPRRFSWTRGQPYSEWIAGNTYGHFEEHWPDLAKALPGDAGEHPAIRAAGIFLDHSGRDIDRALFGFTFRRLSALDVLDALANYQNPDGGFFGLDMDIESRASNPFATELALRYMMWINPPRDHPVVERVVGYLESTQDAEGNWRFTPEVYQGALAPWFQGWQWPNINPSCPIAGLLKHLGLGSDELHARVQGLFERLAKPADLSGPEFYNAMPYAKYFQTEWDFPLADLYRWGAVWWMVRQHYQNPGMDASHFLDLAPEPENAVARRLPAEVLQSKLEQLLAEQSEDGGWPTPYSPSWRPWTTVNNILILKAYGKV